MNKKLIILVATFLALSLKADCKSYYLLGVKSQDEKKTLQENSIIWDYEKNKWSVSQPQKHLICKNNGYILINNEVNQNIKIKEDAIYKIKKGWNYFTTPKDGIDILKSFQKKQDIEFVYTYDKNSKAWAGYSPNSKLQDKIASTRILSLKYIEPKVGFYIYARKDLSVATQGTVLNQQCQKLIDKGYTLLQATGIDKKIIYTPNKTLSIKSRYASHYRRGVYNDSRVALIFDEKKLPKKFSHNSLTYGPVVPAVMIEYDENIKDNWFFVFDYFKKECYRGMFPSKKIPPFSTLQKLK